MQRCVRVFANTTNATAGVASTRNLLAEGTKDLSKVALPDWKFPIRADDIVEGVVLAVSKNNCDRKNRRIRSHA